MTSVTYPNGYVAHYDETIQVGDLVTTYNAGYHIVTGIQNRPQATPLFLYTKMYHDDGTKSKKLKSKCDGSFVAHAQITLNIEIKKAQEKEKALTNILNSY